MGRFCLAVAQFVWATVVVLFICFFFQVFFFFLSVAANIHIKAAAEKKLLSFPSNGLF